MSRRRVAIAVGAICAIALPRVDALAHNGVGAAFKGKAGHYVVYAYDGELLPTGRLDYKLVLLNDETKNPVYDAHPTVTADRPGSGTSTARVTSFGNVFFYNLPNPYPHDWKVHVRVTGPLGQGAVSYRMHGATLSTKTLPLIVRESGSSRWPIILGSVAGAVLLAGLALFAARGRRARRSPVDGGTG